MRRLTAPERPLPPRGWRLYLHIYLRRSLLCGLPLLLATAAAQAQLYKWSDAGGKIHYSDTPPPASAHKVEQKAIGSDTVSTGGMPYALAEAVKNHPVVLYTTPKCEACEQGRALLHRRGVPFTEKTVVSSEDIAKLREAGGEQQLPLLKVGRSKQHGFEPGAWNAMLSAAAYPESNQLPKQYKHKPAEAAAARSTAADAAAANAASANAGAADAQLKAEALPVQGKNVPPGFRF